MAGSAYHLRVSQETLDPLIPSDIEMGSITLPSHLDPDSSGGQTQGVNTEAPDQAIGRPTTRDHRRGFQVAALVPTAVTAANTPATPHDDGSFSEFRTLSYTAITADPQSFTTDHGYRLRPVSCSPRRHTEILVGITLYNEDKTLLCRTLHSIVANCLYLSGRSLSKIWGNGSWKKIVVCIIADGMEAVDPGVLDILATIGLYQDGLCRKKTPDGTEVLAHLFEYSSRISVDEKLNMSGTSRGESSHPPVQLMFLLKARNCGKLNSWRWIYNAFGGILDPNIVVHVDVGTKLDHMAMYFLWKAFDVEPRTAAACGELVCSKDRGWVSLLNPLVAAQNFEYKVGFQLDRTFESATGYLSVLPGAFSAYRHAGSKGKPLDDTLIGDPTWVDAHTRDPKSQTPMNLNRHLAEDRAICFELIIKPECHWLTKYVQAKATTDIPVTTTDFINQRRRWLNGAFFSTVYALKNAKALSQSQSSPIRKALFYVQLAHSTLSLVLAWFSLAAFLLATFTINSITGEPPADQPISGFPFGSATPAVNGAIQIVYLATILFQFILALGSRPRNHGISYVISFFIFGIVQLYLIVNILYLIKRVADFRADNAGASSYAYIGEFYADLGPATVIVSAFSVFGVYVLAALLAFDPWHLFTSFAQFLFVSSSYVNILNIYAFSNTHDVTWGHNKSRYQELLPTTAQPQPTAGPAAIERRFTFDDQNPTLRSADSARDESIEARDAEYSAVRARAIKPDSRRRDHQPPRVLATADKMLEFRTILLASYIFSNFFICLIVLNDSLKPLWWLGDSYWHKIWFFRIWLWANSVSFLTRLLGCIWYHIVRLFQGI